MSISYEEFLHKVKNGRRPKNIVAEAYRELSKFYKTHKNEFVTRVRGPYQMMLENMDMYLANYDYETQGMPFIYETLVTLQEMLEDLQMVLKMTPLQIAQFEVDNKDHGDVSDWAYGVLNGTITEEQCYWKPNLIPTTSVRERLKKSRQRKNKNQACT